MSWWILYAFDYNLQVLYTIQSQLRMYNQRVCCKGACACEKHSETCLRCLCMWHFLGSAVVHFLYNNGQNCYFLSKFIFLKLIFDFLSHPTALKKNHWRISENWVQMYFLFEVVRGTYEKYIVNFRRYGCGYKVRPPYNEGARTWACTLKSGRARCVCQYKKWSQLTLCIFHIIPYV